MSRYRLDADSAQSSASVDGWADGRLDGPRLPRAELDALHETALLVAERREMPELLHLILTRAAALVGVKDAFLYLLEPDRQTLAIVAGIGEFASQIGFSVPGRGRARRSGRRGRRAADRLRRGELRGPFAQARADDGAHDRGGAAARNRRHPRRDRPRASQLLRLRYGGGRALDRFGRVASIALDNARLHESLQVELAERRRTEEELLDTVSS